MTQNRRILNMVRRWETLGPSYVQLHENKRLCQTKADQTRGVSLHLCSYVLLGINKWFDRLNFSVSWFGVWGGLLAKGHMGAFTPVSSTVMILEGKIENICKK